MRENGSTGVLAAVGSAVGGILFGLLLAGGLVAIIATYFGDYNIVTVRTGSMEPTLAQGDIAIIKPERIDKIDEEDIIYFNAGAPTIHRVVAIREEVVNVVDGDELVDQTHNYFFVTRGDANPANDGGDVGINEFQGKLWFTIPTFGLLGSSISPTWIMIGLSLFFGAAWGIYELVIRKRKPAKQKKKARSGRPLPQAAGQQEIRKIAPPPPSAPSRAALAVASVLDRILLAIASAWGAFRGLFRVRVGADGKVRNTARAGAGLWILVPATVWLAAVGIVVGSSALADGAPTWNGENSVSGEIKVRIPTTPTPKTPKAPHVEEDPSVTPTPTCEPGTGTPGAEPSVTETPTPTPSPTPSPSPTASPSPSASPTASVSPTPGGPVWDFINNYLDGLKTAQAAPSVFIAGEATPCVGEGGGSLPPSPSPSASAAPSASPSPSATTTPTATPSSSPTEDPTDEPTEDPTEEATGEPTEEPTATPTGEPTEGPTAEVTEEPTQEPTAEPTETATEEPADTPTP